MPRLPPIIGSSGREADAGRVEMQGDVIRARRVRFILCEGSKLHGRIIFALSGRGLDFRVVALKTKNKEKTK
jgi:hypothetical protein